MTKTKLYFENEWRKFKWQTTHTFCPASKWIFWWLLSDFFAPSLTCDNNNNLFCTIIFFAAEFINGWHGQSIEKFSWLSILWDGVKVNNKLKVGKGQPATSIILEKQKERKRRKGRKRKEKKYFEIRMEKNAVLQ